MVVVTVTVLPFFPILYSSYHLYLFLLVCLHILKKTILLSIIVRTIISSSSKTRDYYSFTKYRLMSAIQITRKFFIAAMSVLSPRFFVKYFTSRTLQLESCNVAHYNLLMVGMNALFDKSSQK